MTTLSRFGPCRGRAAGPHAAHSGPETPETHLERRGIVRGAPLAIRSAPSTAAARSAASKPDSWAALAEGAQRPPASPQSHVPAGLQEVPQGLASAGERRSASVARPDTPGCPNNITCSARADARAPTYGTHGHSTALPPRASQSTPGAPATICVGQGMQLIRAAPDPVLLYVELSVSRLQLSCAWWQPTPRGSLGGFGLRSAPAFPCAKS